MPSWRQKELLVKVGETLKFMIRDAKGGIVRNRTRVANPFTGHIWRSKWVLQFTCTQSNNPMALSRARNIFPQAGNYWFYVDYTPPINTQQATNLA